MSATKLCETPTSINELVDSYVEHLNSGCRIQLAMWAEGEPIQEARATRTMPGFALTYGEDSKIALAVQAASFKITAATAQKIVNAR